MTMMRCGSAGASILLAAAVVTFALPLAAQQGERRIESDKYIARIIESTPSSNTSYGDHILLVIDKAEKLAFRLEALGSGTFDSMNLYQDRLVFFGKHGTNAQGAMVFDLRRREVIDSFLCWYKTVSPSGRWITYNWHYPRFAHNLYSDILLFYDLERPPAENRVEGSESRGDQYFIARNVGVPVYPPENASPRVAQCRRRGDPPPARRGGDHNFIESCELHRHAGRVKNPPDRGRVPWTFGTVDEKNAVMCNRINTLWRWH
jgi:hypothetical protein